jgi:hypothetical protein
MRRIILSAAFVVGLVLISMPTAPAAPLKVGSCPTDRPLVVDVTLSVKNLADYGTPGHVWALDDFTEHVQMWQIGPKQFCVRRESTGTWTSFAGVSPGGTGTISAGLTGTLHGVVYVRLIGEFDPIYPTTGYIGEFDGMCQQDGTCTGTLPRSRTLYFPRLYHVDEKWFDFVATSDDHGTWHQTPAGDTGDITG